TSPMVPSFSVGLKGMAGVISGVPVSNTQPSVAVGPDPWLLALAGITAVMTRSDRSFRVLQLAATRARVKMRWRVFMCPVLLLLALVARARRGGDDGLRAVDDAGRDE